MTCKDCIHCKQCESVCKGLRITIDDVNASTCKNFEDKSKYIRLPCKVGDTVYFLDTKTEKQGRKKVVAEYIGKGLVDNIVLGYLGVPQVHVCDDNNIWTTFEGTKDFGKIVFLTYEEAEKALRERETNDK